MRNGRAFAACIARAPCSARRVARSEASFRAAVRDRPRSSHVAAKAERKRAVVADCVGRRGKYVIVANSHADFPRFGPDWCGHDNVRACFFQRLAARLGTISRRTPRRLAGCWPTTELSIFNGCRPGDQPAAPKRRLSQNAKIAVFVGEGSAFPRPRLCRMPSRRSMNRNSSSSMVPRFISINRIRLPATSRRRSVSSSKAFRTGFRSRRCSA